MEETISYLYSWCCTRDGDYRMVNYRSVKMAVLRLLGGSFCASGEESRKIINAFKNGVKNGDIPIYDYLFCLTDSHKNELREEHRQNVNAFEKKYDINNERD